MSGVFNDIGESVANLFGAGPSGGPLGSAKNILGPAVAGALNFIPGVGSALSAADFAGQAGGQFSKGNDLGGALDLAGAGYGAYSALGPGAAGAGASASGAAGVGGAAGAGGSATPGVLGTLENGVSTVGSDISNAATNTGDYISNLFTGNAAAPVTGVTSSAPAGMDDIAAANFATDAGGNPVANVLSGAGDTAPPTASTLGSLASSLKSNASWLVPTVGGVGSLIKQALTPAQSGQEGVSNSAAGEQALLGQDNAALSQQLQQQIASIRAHYASLGESGSSAELQDIAAAQNNETGTQFNINSGILSQAGNQYGQLANIQNQQDQDLSQSISDFALAAGLGFGANKNAP